jgi:hypothetical protein
LFTLAGSEAQASREKFEIEFEFLFGHRGRPRSSKRQAVAGRIPGAASSKSRMHSA